MQITSIEGNRQWLDGGSMFGNAPRALWEKWTEVDSQGRIPLACRCLFVEIDGVKILCETGIGAFFEPKLAQRFGVQNPEANQLLVNLQSMGIAPEEIDYVILSHLHFDHAGGLLPSFDELQKDHWELNFPKAKYIVGKTAWERALNPHFRDRASFLPHLNQALEKSGRLEIIENGQAPAPLKSFLSFYESQGHTPGQLHSLFKSNDKSIIFSGDLIPGANWVHLPITMGYDRYPEKLIEEKQRLYSNFENQHLELFFTHDPLYSKGRLSQNEKGRFICEDLTENFARLDF